MEQKGGNRRPERFDVVPGLMYKLCHEDLSPANPSCSKNAHVDKEVCNRRAKQFKAAVAARNRLGIDVATKLVAIKANLGSSEAPRGVDEMTTWQTQALTE